MTRKIRVSAVMRCNLVSLGLRISSVRKIWMNAIRSGLRQRFRSIGPRNPLSPASNLLRPNLGHMHGFRRTVRQHFDTTRGAAGKATAKVKTGIPDTRSLACRDRPRAEGRAEYPASLICGRAGDRPPQGQCPRRRYRKALGEGRESVAAAIFWLKTRAQWKETVVAEMRHDAADPLTALLLDVAENGRRIHDR